MLLIFIMGASTSRVNRIFTKWIPEPKLVQYTMKFYHIYAFNPFDTLQQRRISEYQFEMDFCISLYVSKGCTRVGVLLTDY